jgi:membrane protease YdiL (CAAX protease family)
LENQVAEPEEEEMRRVILRNIINWKTFIKLSVACAITSIMVIPYQAALVPEVAEMGAAIYLIALAQGAVIFSIVTFLGLLLAPKVGFSLPVLEGDNRRVALRAILVPSILLGVLSGVLIVLVEFLVFQGLLDVNISLGDTHVPVWAAFMASFYGGIAEEVLMRLFVMTLFVWLLSKIRRRVDADNPIESWSVWVAIAVASILFGIGHLPLTGELTEITAPVVARAIVLNGIGGVIFGWLYWKKGLESAIIAHFSADIVLHIITPMVTRGLVSQQLF